MNTYLNLNKKMMQYDSNNTDKNLRQLESQSLPDLSKMDDHWQQMKAAMATSAQSGSVSSLLRKPGFYIIAAIITGIILFVLLAHPSNDKIAKADEVIVQPVPPADTPRAKYDKVVKIEKTEPAPKYDKKLLVVDTVRIVKDTMKATVQIPIPSRDYSAELETFYQKLEKQPQHFVIDPLQDTIIHGKDGNSLMIPANTFNTGPVTIVLKEYYTYQDIITNRLSTSSFGMPLVTGGMIHIKAMINGKEINMQPGKSIHWFIPDTSAQMKQMQLFTGITEKQYSETRLNWQGDSISNYTTYNAVDWLPQQQFFSDDYFITKVKVLDLRDIPVRTKSGKNGRTAIFRLSDNPRMSRKEIEKALQQKYPHYAKIKVKEKAGVLTKARKSEREMMTLVADGVGDSVWMFLEAAQQYNLTATDTITALSRQINYEFGPPTRSFNTLTTLAKSQMASRYSVDIRTLGWINCDRFLQDRRPKIQFIIDLQDTASNYYTMLIFDEVKSIMNGAVSGNKVLFNNIPEGIKAKIICVGIKDGKGVTASEDIVASATPFKELKFEETTPAEFKKEVGMLDK